MQANTGWKLDQLTNRLESPLKQERNPQAAMRRISQRLLEEDLSHHYPSPKESPYQFASMVIQENPQMWDEVASMSLPKSRWQQLAALTEAYSFLARSYARSAKRL